MCVNIALITRQTVFWQRLKKTILALLLGVFSDGFTVTSCLVSSPATWTLAVVLTQKVDPQYWSRTAAHMVHADGRAFLRPSASPLPWFTLLGFCYLCPDPVHPQAEDNRRTCHCEPLNYNASKQKPNFKTSCREITSVCCSSRLPSVTVYNVLGKGTRIVQPVMEASDARQNHWGSPALYLPTDMSKVQLAEIKNTMRQNDLQKRLFLLLMGRPTKKGTVFMGMGVGKLHPFSCCIPRGRPIFWSHICSVSSCLNHALQLLALDTYTHGFFFFRSNHLGNRMCARGNDVSLMAASHEGCFLIRRQLSSTTLSSPQLDWSGLQTPKGSSTMRMARYVLLRKWIATRC